MDQQAQMEFFYQIFDASLPRLGPGTDASTRKALSMILPRISSVDGTSTASTLRILDLGCGNGAQTMQLAEHTNGTILAVDNHQPFLNELERRAEAAGVLDQIRIHLGDMANLDLDEGAFDLIWSEGSLYSMGFAEGLAAYHAHLAPGGCFAVSELCWLRGDAPDECCEFFGGEYPSMTDVEDNLALARTNGYELVGHFTLPESAWRDAYYRPLEGRLRSLRGEHAGDPDRLELIESVQKEIDMYRSCSRYYGYVFYLMKR